MNLENSTHIIFVHKMETEIEKQVIGRAQRMGRTSVLNIIYLQYENESKFVVDKPINLIYDEESNKNELENYYNEQQFYYLMENIQKLDFIISNIEDINNINTNEISYLEQSTTQIELSVLDIPEHQIDVNLEELISNLH